MLDSFFHLSENKTNVRTEVLAGVTTFLTMAYIIFVQPAVLATDFAGQPTGIDPQAVLLATCLASAIATVVMGLLARYPIALAPGMGENFFFVTVVMGLTSLGITQAWKVALAIVFLSGSVFVVLSLFRVREAIMDGMSPSMSNAVAAGIGLFIAFIGLKNAGLIVGNPGTLVGLDAHMEPHALAVLSLGLLVTSVLHVRRVRGSTLIGILSAAVLAAILGKARFTGFVGLPKIEHTAILQMDFKQALSLTCLPFILVFLFMDMFDTVGTLVGVSQQAGLMQNNRLPRAGQALLADAVGTVVGAALGTSTVTSYIESATGVEQGGRTGLTALTTAALFLLAVFFSPVVAMVGQYPPITAPALVVVGALMMQNARRIDWGDFSEAIPSFLMMIGIPLCFSIADGLALGFMSYPLIKLLSGKGKDVKWLMYVLAVILMAYFFFVRTRL
ncbi:MAG: NCS2 family permease [Kiritimatiellae bacterium]|nr:NCS2 family permease [Kiritimatiellia bacterium]